MSRTRKRILIVLGSIVGLVVLAALAVPLLLDLDRYKPQLETVASGALGMDVRIGGRVRIGLLPGLHVTVEDGRIVDEKGATIASAKQVRLWIDLLPLLHKEVRLNRIELTQPALSIERDLEGRLNVERLKLPTLLGLVDGARVTASDGTLHYTDRKSGQGIEAGDFTVVSLLRLATGNPRLLKGLTLEAQVGCREILTSHLRVTALRFSVHAKDGIFDLSPVTMEVFGGQAVGSLRADVAGPVPLGQIRCSLPSFRIEEFLRTLSPKKAAEGTMSFSASLSMQGTTGSEWMQSTAGEIVLKGEHLTLLGHDLDRELSRFASSQGFNLVDVGAVFLAGPLGLVVSKGYNFGSLFEGSGGQTSIGTLVSQWTVERGVAQAKDVAMATPRNRIALQGGLDFVHQSFADLTAAVIDAKGCATVRQAIRGSFGSPTVEKPRVLRSLAGPMLKLYRQTRGLFPSGPCEIFYAGSVAPPR